MPPKIWGGDINGFTKVKDFGSVSLLKNDYDVALGRFYDKSITEKDFELDQYNNDNLLSNAVILEHNTNFDVTSSDLELYKHEQNNEDILSEFQNMPLANFKKVGNDSNLACTFESPYEGILFIAVPYEGGWSAYVDGQKTDILKANYGFSAIQLSKGKHDIEMNFTPPWIKEGIIISGVAFLILVLSVMFQKKEVVELND